MTTLTSTTSTTPTTQATRDELFDVAGRRAIVTGASRGIGRAIAVELARRGADVLAVARSRADLEETARLAADGPGRIVVHVADLSSPEQISGTVARACEELGGIDILVNNAAADHLSSFEDTSLETYQTVLDLNVQSCWLLCREASDALRANGGGTVINVASMLGQLGWRHENAYVIAKHALVGLTRSLALEWARRGVRVNALGPGYVETAMTVAGLIDDDRYSKWVLKNTPQARWAQPEEMASAVVFLASPAARFMTGQLLVVDGGWSAR